MTVLLVSSAEDPASTNIKNDMLTQSAWEELGSFFTAPVYRHATHQKVIMVTVPDKKIRHENIDIEIHDQLGLDLKLVIFLSRHRSKMGEPTLTVHPIGNYGTAEFGGKPQTLIPTAPRLMAHLLRLIKKNLQTTDLPFQVCYEVTHHGPFLRAPTVFAEVGSTETQWQQKEPAHIIAVSLLQLLEKYRYEEDFPSDIPVLLGIGGGHYAPRFTDIVFEKKAAFGHMIPSYHIDTGAITWDMIEKALAATPNVSGVYLHKKSLKKSQVTEYKQMCNEHGIHVFSSSELPSIA